MQKVVQVGPQLLKTGHARMGQFHFGLTKKATRCWGQRAKIRKSSHQRKQKISTGSWQHVAFVHTGSEVRLFRNGQLISSGKVNGLNNQGKLKSLGIGTKSLTETKALIVRLRVTGMAAWMKLPSSIPLLKNKFSSSTKWECKSSCVEYYNFKNSTLFHFESRLYIIRIEFLDQ